MYKGIHSPVLALRTISSSLLVLSLAFLSGCSPSGMVKGAVSNEAAKIKEDLKQTNEASAKATAEKVDKVAEGLNEAIKGLQGEVAKSKEAQAKELKSSLDGLAAATTVAVAAQLGQQLDNREGKFKEEAKKFFEEIKNGDKPGLAKDIKEEVKQAIEENSDVIDESFREKTKREVSALTNTFNQRVLETAKSKGLELKDGIEEEFKDYMNRHSNAFANLITEDLKQLLKEKSNLLDKSLYSEVERFVDERGTAFKRHLIKEAQDFFKNRDMTLPQKWSSEVEPWLNESASKHIQEIKTKFRENLDQHGEKAEKIAREAVARVETKAQGIKKEDTEKAAQEVTKVLEKGQKDDLSSRIEKEIQKEDLERRKAVLKEIADCNPEDFTDLDSLLDYAQKKAKAIAKAPKPEPGAKAEVSGTAPESKPVYDVEK